MLNSSRRIKNSEITSSDSASQIHFRFPIKNTNPNNISFKNSVYLMKSEQKANNHRQYLIDFIRDNNNKNRKEYSNNVIKEEQEEKQNQEILDKNNFFNDYFYHQKKLEKNSYNKIHKNELLMDIIDYIGEEAHYPINIDIMNIKMLNFIPGKISSKSFGLINSYAANTNQGIDRNYNDDRVKIMINMNRPANYVNKSQWPLISYFAIFDGHNGEHCAEFLRKNLLQYIYTNPNFPRNIEKAIKEGFIKADQDYLLNFSDMYQNRNTNGNIPVYELCNNSGSCGLILLIVDTKIYIANVGDSRCLVSCQNGKVQKDVTRDHKPEFPYEKQRIYSHGGSIYQNETIFSEEEKKERYVKNSDIKNKILLGPFRVNPGKLSVSRTIGDAKAKLEKYGGMPMVVIPEPDVYVFDYYKDNIDYFIMGCDGIFDRIKSYEIFKCVDNIVKKEKKLIKNNNIYNNSFNTLYDRKINMNTTCGNVVDMILRLSMLRKSYDNVTCIMIAFKDLIFDKNSNNNENNYQDKAKENKNNLINSYDRNNFKLINERYHKNNNNFIRLNKDIHIGKPEVENRKNISQENNRYFYKRIENSSNISSSNADINKFKNNFFYTDKERKNKIYNIENNKENENQNPNNKKLQSQSQEKKIRELITLFSINNKKRSDNDNTSFLYNTYNSKNKEQNNNKNVNNNSQISIHKNYNFNNSSVGNSSTKNISFKDISKEKKGTQNKSTTISGENPSAKYRRIYNLKNYDLDKNKSSYLNRKNISKKIQSLKMFSNIEEDENDSDIKEEKSYVINNNSNKIKSNSTENLYATPSKQEEYNKRITSRKIVRKTNNIYIQKNNLRETLNNEYNNRLNISKQSLDNSKNNFFHSVVLSNKKENNKYKPNNDSFNSSNVSINSQVNIRKINYDRYKVKNKKIDNLNASESINGNKSNRYEKIISTKYEKNSKYLNEKNLANSSSISIIYTKKRKIK